MNDHTALFWAILSLLILNVAAMVLFWRVLNRIKAMAEANVDYAAQIEDDLRKTRRASTALLAAMRLDSGVESLGVSDEIVEARGWHGR